MTTEQIVKLLEESESLLPRDLLVDMTEQKLASEMLKIYADHQDKILKEQRFQSNFIEIINYLVVTNLDKPKSRERIFKESFINKLLALPDPA